MIFCCSSLPVPYQQNYNWMKDPNIYYQSNFLSKTVKKKYREMAGLYIPANSLGGMAHLHGESGEEQPNSQEHRQFLHQGPFLKKFHAKRYNQLFQVCKSYVAPIDPYHPFDSKALSAIQQNQTLVSYLTLDIFTSTDKNTMSALTSAGLVGLQIWYHKKMVWSWKLGLHS